MVDPTTAGNWPDSLPAIQCRFARPTNRMDEVIAFYGEHLGLPELHRGSGDGWSAVMFGLPGDRYNLEFVAHEEGLNGDAPTAENLLVFYFEDTAAQEHVLDRLRGAGIREVTLDNPWWSRNGAVAVADPDGWRVVLMPKPVPLVGMPTGAQDV